MFSTMHSGYVNTNLMQLQWGAGFHGREGKRSQDSVAIQFWQWSSLAAHQLHARPSRHLMNEQNRISKTIFSPCSSLNWRSKNFWLLWVRLKSWVIRMKKYCTQLEYRTPCNLLKRLHVTKRMRNSDNWAGGCSWVSTFAWYSFIAIFLLHEFAYHRCGLPPVH